MKVTFDFSKSQIAIEGDAPELLQVLQLVRDVAPKLPDISIVTQPGRTTTTPTPSNGSGSMMPSPQSGAVPTMRAFVKAMRPTNAAEKIAVIAFYQSRFGNQPVFSPKQMGDWFTHAGLQKPSQMSVAVFDTKRKYGYLESAGHGAWKLSTQGENLVVSKEEASMSQPTSESD